MPSLMKNNRANMILLLALAAAGHLVLPLSPPNPEGSQKLAGG